MLAAALITFREGLEAALVVGIVLGVLSKTGYWERRRSVWWGVAAATVASILAAVGLQLVGAKFEGRAEELFEGVVMLLAAGVLTYMVFWMLEKGQHIKAQLEMDVQEAIKMEGSWALFVLAFLVVFREGIETALFLSAAAFSSTPVGLLTGALLGLIAAVVAGWLLFMTSVRLDVRKFFQITSFLLIIFAAGLVAHGVHELQEAAVLPVLVEHVWDLNPVLDENSTVGSVLKSLFGYNGNPSLIEVLSYVGYFVVIWLSLRRKSCVPERSLAR